MKLSSADIKNLSCILATCHVGSIDSIIIEDGRVRGMNDERSFVIVSDTNVPVLPIKIGISRLKELKQRIDMFSGSDIQISLNSNDRGEVSAMDISAGRSKVQFRCASTSLIKAPKSINDEHAHSIIIERDELKLILNAIKVMGTATLQITIKKSGEVFIGASDVTNDAFNIELTQKAHAVISSDSVVHYYFADSFSQAMRVNSEASENELLIGEMGTIRTQLNGHQIVLMPKINDEGDD